MECGTTIYLQKGASAIVQVDLTEFDMQGGTVVLTMRDALGTVVREWEFTEARMHNILFEDEFTAKLRCGRFNYMYDIMWHLNGERFMQCSLTPIIIERTAGGCHND